MQGCAVCAEPKCVRGAAAAAGQGQEAPPPQMEEGADEPEQLQTAQPPAKIKKQQGGSGSDIGVALAVQLPSTVDTPSCPEMGQRASFDAFLTDKRGDPTVPTPFGRSLSGGGCACRFCDDVTTGLHQPAHLVNDTEASLCFSTYDDENMMATGLLPTHPGTGCTDVAGYGSLGKDELLEQMAMANTTDNVAALVPTFEGCLAPDRSADGLPKQVLFLVGNSHSGARSAAVKRAVRGAYQVRSLTIGSTYLSEVPDLYPAGYAAITEALKGLLQPGDILCPVWWQGGPRSGTKIAGPLTELLESVVVPSGANMLVLGPYPEGVLSQAWEETTGFSHGEAMAALAEKYPQLHYVDLYRPFCDIDDESNACSCVTTPGQVVSAYFNEHHISVAQHDQNAPLDSGAAVHQHLLSQD